jgi:hypothetical protein
MSTGKVPSLPGVVENDPGRQAVQIVEPGEQEPFNINSSEYLKLYQD